MHHRPCILLAFCLQLVTAAPALAQLEVLFIGNSHTYYNDLPGLVAGLATAGGHEIYTEASVPGGYSLNQHLSNQTTLGMIASRAWDHVVLQEHSKYPVIPHHRDNYFYPAARALDEYIQVCSGNTSFFMTWGYQYGGQQCIGAYCSPDYPDYWAMQRDVTAAYEAIAEELEALLVPVGSYWREALLEDGTSQLWAWDHYHPSAEGSYLAACVFYTRFFGESPEGLEFHGAIDPERAQFYQSIAGGPLTAVSDAPAGAGTPVVRLLSGYPNPFNPVTTLRCELPREAPLLLEFFDSAGRLVDRIDAGLTAAGRHELRWDAGAFPTGIYHCRLRAGNATDCRKLTLLR